MGEALNSLFEFVGSARTNCFRCGQSVPAIEVQQVGGLLYPCAACRAATHECMLCFAPFEYVFPVFNPGGLPLRRADLCLPCWLGTCYICAGRPGGRVLCAAHSGVIAAQAFGLVPARWHQLPAPYHTAQPAAAQRLAVVV